MLDVDIIEINDDQAHASKLLASSLSDAQTRKRGMLDMLGITCAISYLHAKKVRIDTKRSVYKIPLLFEEFIYIVLITLLISDRAFPYHVW